MIRCRAYLVRARCLAEVGGAEEANRCLAMAEPLAADLGQPALRWIVAWNRVGWVALAGHLDEAERAARAAYDLGVACGQADALLYLGAPLALIARQQGSLGERLEFLTELAERFPAWVQARLLLAEAYCALGREADARAIFDPMVAERFSGYPFDMSWTAGMAAGAQVAVHLGDTAAAGELYERLRPYADLVVGQTSVGCGTVSHYLGRLAATLGRHDEADRHFAHAAALEERIGAPVWVARTHQAWAEVREQRPGGIGGRQS